MIDRPPAPELDRLQEYKLRCRIVVAGAEVLMVQPYELAEGPGGFRRPGFGPELRTVPRFKIIREEPWERATR